MLYIFTSQHIPFQSYPIQFRTDDTFNNCNSNMLGTQYATAGDWVLVVS